MSTTSLPNVWFLIGAYALLLMIIGATCFWWFRPEPRTMIIWCVSGLVALSIPALIFSKWQQQDSNAKALRENGVVATGTIIRAKSTAVRVNKRPQIKLRLRIALPDGESYEHEALVLVPLGQSADPGRRLPVHVDPRDRERILIDWESAPETAESTLAERLQQLDALRDKGLITEQEHRDQRQRLLSQL